MPVTDPAILAMQAKLRANISSATGAQFDAQGNNTKVADSYNKLNGVTTPTAAPAPSYESSYKGPDITGMTDKLNQGLELRKTAELDAIRRERETALQGYNKMETQTKTQAYDNRNSADVVSMQNAQRLRQSMADMGLINSGDNITAQSQGNAQRQGAIGSINRDESQTLTDIGERRNLAINQAAGRESSLIAGLEAERLDRQIALEQYGDGAMREWDNTQYGRFDSNRNFDRQTGRDARGDFVDDRNYDRGILESDRGYNRDVFTDNRDYGRGVLESDRGFNRGVLESDRNYNLDVSREGRISSGGGGSGGSSGGSGGKTKLPALTTYAGLLQDQFMPYDPVSRTRKIANPDALERAILSSGYDEAQMQQLYDLFGLNLNSGNSSDRPVSGPLPME